MFSIIGITVVAESFHVYAPSRTANQVIVVQAIPGDEEVALNMEERIDLKFSPATITQHPKQPLLYVVSNRGSEEERPAVVLHLNKAGQVVKQTPFKVHNGYSYLSLDRANRFLLASNYREGRVDVYSLDAQGIPQRRVTALDEGRRNAHCVKISPDNRSVYIPYVKETNGILQYDFDPKTGGLRAKAVKSVKLPESIGPRHLVYHPSLPFVYFSNEQQLGVSVFEWGENGALSFRQATDIEQATENRGQGVSSSDIVITPDGRFLFSGIRGHKKDFNFISAHRIRPDGRIDPVGLTPADSIPWGLALSPDANFLLATGFKAATLMAFEIAEDGRLERVGSLDWDASISDLETR